MNIIKNVTASAFLLVFLVIPTYTNAQIDVNNEYKQAGLKKAKYNDRAGITGSVTEIMVEVIKFMLNFLGALAVVVIVVAGIMYITSGGDEGKVETAKKWIMYAIVGLIIALLGWVIINIVSKLVIG